MHLLSLNRAIEAFDSHGLRAQNDKLLDVQDMVTILTSVFEILAKENSSAVDMPLNIDLIINWILNIYDRYGNNIYRFKCNGQFHIKNINSVSLIFSVYTCNVNTK